MGRQKGYKKTQEEKDKIRESCKNAIVIHHINGNHLDDRPENRMVVTPSEHIKIHMLQGDIHTFKKGHKINLGKRNALGKPKRRINIMGGKKWKKI